MEEEPIFKELLDKHCLSVLKAFIRDFGLYWHQLSSFNDLFEQHLENLEDVYIDPVVLKVHGNNRVLHFRFGQIRYSRANLVDDDNRVTKMFPKLARMRGETYGAGLHVDIHVFTAENEEIELSNDIVQSGFNRRRRKPPIMEDFEEMEDDGLEEVELDYGITHRVQPQVFLTLFPIMVGSRLCRLHGLPEERLIELGEPIYEPMGYFILRGKERVIISQKNLGKNTLFISRESDEQILGTLHASVECPDIPRVVNKIDLNYDKEVHDTLIKIHINQVYAQKGVPLGIIFTMCGISEWTEVINLVSGFARVDSTVISKVLRASENDLHSILARYENHTKFDAAWNWFSDHVSSKQRIKMQDKLPDHPEVKRLAAQEVVHTYLFPHVQDGIPQMQSPEDYWSVCRVKALTLAHLVSQVIRVHLKIDKPTDRDHMEHRRYDSPGSLLLKLFRSLLRPQLSDFRTQIANMDKNNKPIDIASAMCSERLQKGLIGALQSGKFQLTRRTGRQSAATATAGVSQAFSRINPSTGISLLRKTASQGTRKIPAGARLLHPTQWGFQCVAETPEGQPCGIVNHLTLLSYCSAEYPSKIVFDWILRMIPDAVPVYSLDFNASAWRIVINGRVAFSVESSSSPEKWVRTFKQSRYLSEIPRDISISFNPVSDTKEIRIYCDGGRLIRPLCVVDNRKLRLTAEDIVALENKGKGVKNTNLEELFREGKFEYLDGAETEDAYIATMFSDVSGQEDYTHCEACPLSILGVAASLSPYSDANQSPRNVYSAGMTKQAMGTPSFPIHGNLRTTDHMLENSERPLVSTLLHRVDELPMKWLPTGKNCIVCVKADAHNVEDSIIMNETFIQNGGLASFTDRTYTQTAQKNHHHSNMDAETFERPEEEKTAQYKSEARYDKIHGDGLPVPNELVTSETIIIGKTGPLPTPPADPTARNRSVDRSHINADPNHTRRDLSTMPRKNGGGVIQSVVLSHTRDTKRAAVTVRTYRKPQIGDKFASRHGQKGTISRVAPSDEMPRGINGVVPDIIMNPHAFPSRMTVGQILESGLGMIAAESGFRQDATTFFGPKKDEILEDLYQLRFQKYCETRVMDPKTGEMMDALLFIGLVYYQTLKHVVEEKIHARNRGPVTRSNRQPVEGRRRDGGLRFGEMEKDATVASGAAQITRERLCDVSDQFMMPIHQPCGHFATREPTNHESYICTRCDSRDDIVKEIVTYPSKQLVHYLAVMGIDMSFIYGNDRSDQKVHRPTDHNL